MLSKNLQEPGVTGLAICQKGKESHDAHETSLEP